MVERPEGEVKQITEPEQPDQEHQARMFHADGAETPEQLDSLPEQILAISHDDKPKRSVLDELTAAIEHYPGAPSNYVLRGELYLDVRLFTLAAQDFQKALELADPLAESANWGYINEALADRAREGLRQCK